MSAIQHTIDALQDVVMLFDREWRIQYTNATALRWFREMIGVEEDEVQGKVIWDIAPTLKGTRYEREYRRAMQEQRDIAFEAYSPQRSAWYNVRAYPAGDALLVQIRDITRERQGEQFLLEASRVLSETLDYNETIRLLARLAVPRMADWCVVHLADEQGRLVGIEAAHVDPEKVAFAHALLHTNPLQPETNVAAYRVYRTGKSERVSDITDEMLVASVRDSEDLDIVRRLGFRSSVIVPLIAHGRTLGVMTYIYAESGRRYDEDDVAFAEDLATRAASAADNARLFEDAERRRREEAALRLAAEAVAATFSVEAVISQIARSALDATEADGSFVERVQPDTRSVVVVAVAGELHPETDTQLPFEGSLAQFVLERKQPEVIPVLGQATHALPGLLAQSYATSSALAVPLIDAGEAIGCLILLRHERRAPFTTDEAQRAHTFGNLAALAFRKVHLLEDSERRRKELEQVIESRSRLMRGFSHDLKNPLGAADGHAALLADGMLGDLTERQLSSIGRIREGIKTAVDLINDLVELARAESGQMQIRSQPLDVREIVREMVEQYRPAAEQSGLSIQGELGRVEIIPGDADRVRQILGNLLSNAVKYTKEGGIRVRTSMHKSDNDLGSDQVTIDVIDTGIGIPEDRIHLLFTEFERIDPSVRPGAGLGLAISRRIARLLGGDVTVITERGAGSTFTLSLPHK